MDNNISTQSKSQLLSESRRSFLKGLGVLAGTAGVVSVAPWLSSLTAEKQAEWDGETRRARIALIGTGSRGQYHLHNLKNIPHAEVVALCDIYEPHLKEASELFPEARLYTDYHDVLNDPDIDGVIIATPLGSHAPITLDALDAGKHVFCEKAMALTLDQCKAVYDKYLESDNVLYYCMQRMFDPKYVQGVAMIRDGLIGDVVGMRCYWFRNADWRRDCPDPEYERLINCRLYNETSGG
ncbi:MAG: Gfo/Idh/MocA family oxidoreductase, partial [Muribaculaceae bacterium]|nr:Gfo/Idh/MocA family oxidoreductase [Muribaculaceae bacterium]